MRSSLCWPFCLVDSPHRFFSQCITHKDHIIHYMGLVCILSGFCLNLTSFLGSKNRDLDDTEIMLHQIISLGEIMKFSDINRRISREGTQLLFYLWEILKRERSVDFNNSTDSSCLSARAEKDRNLVYEKRLVRISGLGQSLEGDQDVQVVA